MHATWNHINSEHVSSNQILMLATKFFVDCFFFVISSTSHFLFRNSWENRNRICEFKCAKKYKLILCGTENSSEWMRREKKNMKIVESKVCRMDWNRAHTQMKRKKKYSFCAEGAKYEKYFLVGRINKERKKKYCTQAETAGMMLKWVQIVNVLNNKKRKEKKIYNNWIDFARNATMLPSSRIKKSTE